MTESFGVGIPPTGPGPRRTAAAGPSPCRSGRALMLLKSAAPQMSTIIIAMAAVAVGFGRMDSARLIAQIVRQCLSASMRLTLNLRGVAENREEQCTEDKCVSNLKIVRFSCEMTACAHILFTLTRRPREHVVHVTIIVWSHMHACSSHTHSSACCHALQIIQSPRS